MSKDLTAGECVGGPLSVNAIINRFPYGAAPQHSQSLGCCGYSDTAATYHKVFCAYGQSHIMHMKATAKTWLKTMNGSSSNAVQALPGHEH